MNEVDTKLIATLRACLAAQDYEVTELLELMDQAAQRLECKVNFAKATIMTRTLTHNEDALNLLYMDNADLFEYLERMVKRDPNMTLSRLTLTSPDGKRKMHLSALGVQINEVEND